MKKFFAAAAAYALDVTVREGGEERSAKAFIEPLSPIKPDYLSRPTVMGREDDRRYLLIAESAAFSGVGEAEVCCGDRVYEVLRRELMGESHWEGIMRLKEEKENVF